jgi:hypothetical protein
MATINMILALVCVAGGLLVARAFFPHIKVFGGSAVDYLARGFGLAIIAYLARTTYWDVIWLLQGNDASNPYVNIPVSCVILYAQFLALRARLITIPADERAKYNIITCAFYPARVTFRVICRRRQK